MIHVKDVNDNPPVFERPTYRTQITEEDDRNLPKRVLQAGVPFSCVIVCRQFSAVQVHVANGPVFLFFLNFVCDYVCFVVAVVLSLLSLYNAWNSTS